VVEVVLQERGGRADTGGVAHDLAALLAGSGTQIHRIHVPVVLLDAPVEVGDLVDIDEPLVVDDDPALAEVIEVLGDRFHLLVAVVGVLLFVPGEGVAERQEAVVAVAPGFHRFR